VLPKDRVFCITHQNHVPTGPVVLHTGDFVGYCQGCGVLTVLYYNLILKCIKTMVDVCSDAVL